MKKAAIGVLGGSFNPPHQGHRALVRHAARRLDLQGMRVLVTPQNPLKEAGDYAPLDKRIEATKKMMRGLPNVQVAPEAELGPVYAVDSIKRLIMRERGTPFVYILGADSFANLHKWHRWRELMHMLPIAVVSRPGYKGEALHSAAGRAFSRCQLPERHATALAHQKAPAWCYIGGLSQPESSSMIREEADPSKSYFESAT
ncbi:nicotinate-nucleotide adenylyltransferase [Parvularcula maris]|uniref:Probable nicotinate-nucleotide adenylyltransferase n=1 Tax=Parvularcula maris TaxID=2965077 RepID=A0A9X2L8T0_9PROT|nr:nicotinate-nucleotide adenylyltransferase [Parvularcula maris]MCQ8185181.1 nicotinate-nicotinamide nucleotide adenylyltransferase [Parvularcula maris]